MFSWRNAPCEGLSSKRWSPVCFISNIYCCFPQETTQGTEMSTYLLVTTCLLRELCSLTARIFSSGCFFFQRSCSFSRSNAVEQHFGAALMLKADTAQRCQGSQVQHLSAGGDHSPRRLVRTIANTIAPPCGHAPVRQSRRRRGSRGAATQQQVRRISSARAASEGDAEGAAALQASVDPGLWCTCLPATARKQLRRRASLSSSRPQKNIDDVTAM